LGKIGPSYLLSENDDLSFLLFFSKQCLVESFQGKFQKNFIGKLNFLYDHSADPFSMSLYSISAGQHGIEVPIELNNQSLLMELDTGAGISIIS